MNATDRQKLDGALVMVKPGPEASGNPPTAMRGTIRVVDGERAEIVLAFPAMFYGHVRQEVIPLDAAAVRDLLASEVDGTFSITLRGEIPSP